MNVLASDFRKCAEYMRAHGWKCGAGPNATGGGCLMWTIRAAVAPNLGIRLDYWADEVIKVLRVRTGDEYVSLPYWSDSLNPATAAETVAQLFIETAEAIERREAKKPDWNALAMAPLPVAERQCTLT